MSENEAVNEVEADEENEVIEEDLHLSVEAIKEAISTLQSALWYAENEGGEIKACNFIAAAQRTLAAGGGMPVVSDVRLDFLREAVSCYREGLAGWKVSDILEAADDVLLPNQ